MKGIRLFYRLNRIKNRTTRSIFFFCGDLTLLVLSGILSFAILNVVVPDVQLPFPLTDLGIFAAVSAAMLATSGMYNVNWRFVSLHELVRIAKSLSTGATLALITGFFMHSMTSYYPAFVAVTYVFSLLFIGAFRISKRILLEVIQRPKRSTGMVIFGAGNAGEQIVRDIQRNNQWELSIEAIFDDNKSIWGTSIHDIPVLGGRIRLFDYLQRQWVREVVIAAPSIPKPVLREIIDGIKEIRSDQVIKVLPSFHKLIGDQTVSFKHVRDIRIEDVLGRETAEIDYSKIKQDLSQKRILITGAGGTIGGEMVRQVLKFGPEQVIALDIDETELFHLENELKEVDGSDRVNVLVADITDMAKMESVFEQWQPHMIYHAAAYKHVPMMERYPEEAVRVNVGGTRQLAKLACSYDVERFIFISSDKAVNPANVMGATKRVSEQICMDLNDLCDTRFVSVRFGNVLGSRGSVVPLFIDQIKSGGPVTITHPEVKRYFMTIPEAVLLVVQAGVMGHGGEVFMLDMGEPVKIVDMARQLIRLHGLEPDRDIQITYNGLRPGEKLFEELLNAGEGYTSTAHPQVHKAVCNRSWFNGQLHRQLDELLSLASAQETEEIRALLKRLVPTYKYNGELKETQMKQEEIVFSE